MDYIPAKTIITKTKNTSWFGTDYNMNLYKGCCHGCIYCDSRSDCYRISDFDTVRAKENALMIIRDELRHKGRKGVIGTGAMSDPYNPFEKELLLTRHALELVDVFQFGVGIATKGSLITRDIDVLKGIKEHSPLICKITITNAKDEISKKIEPFAPVSSERFKAVCSLSQAGIFTGILLMPLLPFINDSQENISEIIKGAKEAGAKFVYPAFGVTLRNSQREYYYEKLDKSFPGLKAKYMEKYKDKYWCISLDSRALYSYFAKECEKNNLLYKMQDIIRAYKRDYEYKQLTLF